MADSLTSAASAAQWFADRSPQVAGSLPAVPSGQVWLFPSDRFENPVKIVVAGPPDNKIVSFAGRDDVQDNATWVAYNLPVGVAVTLVDSIPADDTLLPADCGRTVTLVGTDKVVAIDLVKQNFNDVASGWYKRPIDPVQGGFVLLENDGDPSPRQYVFLSEWPESAVHAIDHWYINDRADVVWWQLSQGQYLTLFEHPQGTGRSCHEVSGDRDDWGLRLKDSGFRDCASAFSWMGVRPVREEIKDARITAPLAGNVEPVSSTATCENRTSTAQTFEVSISTTGSQTITAEDVSTHGAGGSVSLTTTSTVSAEAPGVGSAEESVELSVSAHYDYTTSKSAGEETSTEQAMTVSETITAAPKTITTATLAVRLGRLRKSQQVVDVKRWYKDPVAGGVQDAATKLWVRDEKTTIVIGGGIELGSTLVISEKPLG